MFYTTAGVGGGALGGSLKNVPRVLATFISRVCVLLLGSVLYAVFEYWCVC